MSGDIKMADISINETVSRVQILTEGGAPFNNVLKTSPPGYFSMPRQSAAIVLHLFGDSNHKIVIPIQYEDELPVDFAENESGLYDTETQTQTIKLTKDGIVIKANSITIDKGLGPKEIAVVGDLTSDGASIVGGI